MNGYVRDQLLLSYQIENYALYGTPSVRDVQSPADVSACLYHVTD
jgi:hypothetical protein